MIKLELEVTPSQMIAIGRLLDGQQPEQTQAASPVIDRIDQIAEDNHKVAVAVAEAAAIKSTEVPDAPASPAATAFDEAAEVPTTAAAAFAADVETAEANIVELGKGTNGQQIPWDARIHGKAKKQNADGSWRLLQGVDRDTLVPQVEAELMAALAANPVAELVDAVIDILTPPPVAATNVAPPTEVPVPPAPAADTTKPTTFAELLPLVTAAKAAGTLTDETIANTCQQLGLAQFGLIATRPDLIPQAAELLGV